MNKKEDLEKLILKARMGDSKALESLILSIQNDIFSLCLRSLFDQETAKECTQEILIEVITHLSAFEQRSSFRTWYYRIAINHLQDHFKSPKRRMNFEEFEEDLLTNTSTLSQQEENTPEIQYQLEEVRLGCTLALLQCLDQKERLSYILGEILMMDSHEAAHILSITPENQRKRLQRSRKLITNFTSKICGIYKADNPCQCSKRLNPAKKLGRIPNGLKDLTSNKEAYQETMSTIRSLKETQRVVAIHRNFKPFCSKDFTKKIRQLINQI